MYSSAFVANPISATVPLWQRLGNIKLAVTSYHPSLTTIFLLLQGKEKLAQTFLLVSFRDTTWKQTLNKGVPPCRLRTRHFNSTRTPKKKGWWREAEETSED